MRFPRPGRAHLLLLIAALLQCGCVYETVGQGSEVASGDTSTGNDAYSITVDGLKRSYLVHVPQEYKQERQWPVVIMFHGGGGKAKAAMWDTGWAAKGDKEGFLTVFPEGTPPDPTRPGSFIGNPQTWNDGSQRPNVGAAQRNVADVEFFSAILDDLKRRFNVDTRRVYVTGFSNGASMSFRVARELSSVIAAIAPVAGSDWLSDKKPERSVPLLYITGTADPLNPIDGGEVHVGLKSFGRKPPAQEMIGRWVELHHCRKTPRVVFDEYGSKAVAYARPDGTDVVVYYRIDGHGHHWPGGRVILPQALAGKNAARLKATDVIWEFFRKHASPSEDEASAAARCGHNTQPKSKPLICVK